MPPLLPAFDARDARRWRGRAVAFVLAAGIGACFWVPAIESGRGWFPAPLDDVYIHFDFARSLGQGHPFEWIAGQGYSSGETSPLYAGVLAAGWTVGFRGRALGIWAALVAIASVASLMRSLGRLMQPCPSPVAWAGALLPLSIGIADWSLFSGMENALFCAAIGRSLEALAPFGRHTGTRERRQWRIGLWGAALVLLRPEAVVLVAVFAITAARANGRRSGLTALCRAGGPGALATGAILGLNWFATGDAKSAGAQLKLLSSNPYLSEVDRSRVFVENLVTLWIKLIRSELSFAPALAIALPLFALVGFLAPRTRSIAGAAAFSSIGWTLLVSWNGNSPHHNFRYYVPALVLLAIAAALGLSAIARTWPRRALVAAPLLLAIGVPKIPGQVRHFRGATANIRDQHIEVGERIARLPEDARVLLGDAGAIPYVSNRSAIDALGLGGYRRMPFAHAAVFGEPATIELIERLAPSERPTHLVLYPNWFPGLTSRFGVELDRVTIQNNVICGGTAKVIYRADWSVLETARDENPNMIDELDVGDVVDEEAHRYIPPTPHGGWAVLDVLADGLVEKRFDGGRVIPSGAAESFVVRRGSSRPVLLRLRTDAGAKGIRVRTKYDDKAVELEAPRAGRWREGFVVLPRLEAGATLTLAADGAEYRSFHVWLERVP